MIICKYDFFLNIFINYMHNNHIKGVKSFIFHLLEL